MAWYISREDENGGQTGGFRSVDFFSKNWNILDISPADDDLSDVLKNPAEKGHENSQHRRVSQHQSLLVHARFRSTQVDAPTNYGIFSVAPIETQLGDGDYLVVNIPRIVEVG